MHSILFKRSNNSQSNIKHESIHKQNFHIYRIKEIKSIRDTPE